MKRKLFAVAAAFCTIFSSLSFVANAEETAPLSAEIVRGDVNGDGYLGTADLVTLRQWLLGVPNIQLFSLESADMCEDGVIDSYDFCVMRKELLDAKPQKLVTCRLVVREVKKYSLMADMIDDKGAVKKSDLLLDLDESLLAQNPEPNDILEVEFNGLIYDSYPGEFQHIYSINVIKNS